MAATTRWRPAKGQAEEKKSIAARPEELRERVQPRTPHHARIVKLLRVIFRFGPSTRDEHTCADASQRGWSSCSSRSWHERREGKADVRVSNRRDSNAQSNPSHGQLKDARIASNLNKRSEFADIVA